MFEKLKTTKAEAKVLIKQELKEKIKGKYNGLVLCDKSKNSTSHYIGQIVNMTVRNHDTELWINNEKRLKLTYQCEKVSADFYFQIITEIMTNQEG